MNASMKAVLPWIVCTVASATLAASAGEQTGTDPTAIWRQVVLPETEFVVEPGTFAVTLTPGGPQQAHLKAVIAWLSSEFGLPSVEESPAIAFASARRMIGLRYRDVPSDRWSSDSDDPHLDTPGEGSDVLALYDDEARMIFLPEGWSGKTPSELSMLVHEMVHHIQNMAGLKFACPEEREKMAFEAQERWLALFGRTLQTEFGLDPFTLLVRTNCLY